MQQRLADMYNYIQHLRDAQNYSGTDCGRCRRSDMCVRRWDDLVDWVSRPDGQPYAYLLSVPMPCGVVLEDVSACE